MITRAAGFILTITGLVLGVWCVQMLMAAGDPPLQVFVVAALAVAMLSVGVRYMLKRQTGPRERSGSDNRGKK